MFLGVGEAGGLGGRVGGQAAPAHSGLSTHYGQAWWGGQPEQLLCLQVGSVRQGYLAKTEVAGLRPKLRSLLRR